VCEASTIASKLFPLAGVLLEQFNLFFVALISWEQAVRSDETPLFNLGLKYFIHIWGATRKEVLNDASLLLAP